LKRIADVLATASGIARAIVLAAGAARAGVICLPCRFPVLSMSSLHVMREAGEGQELYSETTEWRYHAHRKTTWYVHRGDRKRKVFRQSCSEFARRVQRSRAGDLRAPAPV
jgi:hypothetical protein